MSNWSDEETYEPLIADHRNFYKVEKWKRLADSSQTLAIRARAFAWDFFPAAHHSRLNAFTISMWLVPLVE